MLPLGDRDLLSPPEPAGPAPDNLVRALLLFARRLRGAGLGVTISQLRDCLRALELVPIGQKAQVRSLLQAILVSRREELARFREEFRSFWELAFLAEDEEEGGRAMQRQVPPEARGITSLEEICPQEQERETVGAGLERVRAAVDFSRLELGEVAAVEQEVLRMARRVAQRLGRRQRRARRSHHLDFRRTFRRSLPHGGELIQPCFRRRRRVRLHIHCLVDISGSMVVYGYFFLLFLHSLQKVWPATSAYVFSTHLTPVSRQLSEPDFGRAWNRIARGEVNWSGGTDMGVSFQSFYRGHLRRASASRSLVIVVSDGWDRGQVEALDRAMQSIKGHCRELFWLNPLMSSPRYEPVCQGMSRILPYLDYFLPFYNLETLDRFCRCLEGLEDMRRWQGRDIWQSHRARQAAGQEVA